jgi:hypothetical protein
MLKHLRHALVRRSLETAASLGAEAAAAATSKTFTQRFEVKPPLTVFVRGSSVEVNVVYQPGVVVELNASLRASFGWEFATDQDAAGVYIIAKRKLLVGALSSAVFTLTLPPEANLVLHLTPGAFSVRNVDGKLTLPAITKVTTSANPPLLLTTGTHDS